MIIPFNKLVVENSSIENLKLSIESGNICGGGPFSDKVSDYFENKFNINKFIPITSGTHALEAAVILSDITAGDEVIMPSFAFSSSANSVLLRNAKPIFCEINEKTLCIDENDILNKITDKTKCILPIHYGGISCDMDKILEISKKNNLFVIEDAAQSINSLYKDKYLGTLGNLGCFSFHSTKNIYCGEGGGLAINHPSVLNSIADMIVQKGTDRKAFLNGEVDKYTWKSIGSSYVPSDILMSLLYSQLNIIDIITNIRKTAYNIYSSSLKHYIGSKGLCSMSSIPNYSTSNYHIFYIIFENEIIRNKVQNKLKNKGISAFSHYTPLHSSNMGLKLGYKPSDFSITEKTSKGILRLPLYNSITENEVNYVIENLISILSEL